MAAVERTALVTNHPAKGWVFTLNNPEQGRKEELLSYAEDPAQGVAYIVFQLEQGESGTPHYQGYVHLKDKRRFEQVRRLLPGAHIEKRRASIPVAVAYCKKEDTRIDGPWEAGTCPVQGRSLELGVVQRRLDDGHTMADISRDHFGVFLHYSRGLREYVNLHRAQRNTQTKVTVLWGPPGTGKSRYAHHIGGPTAYWLPKPAGSTVWFDGYDGQETVVIDEFYGWIPRDLMQRMCDRYALNVEVKGGSVPFLAKHIIITSNQRPDQWWPRLGLGAMERRLTDPIGRVIEVSTNIQWNDDGSPQLADDGTPIMEAHHRRLEERRPAPIFIPPAQYALDNLIRPATPDAGPLSLDVMDTTDTNGQEVPAAQQVRDPWDLTTSESLGLSFLYD